MVCLLIPSPRMYVAKKQERSQWKAYVKPFSWKLWLSVVGVIIILSLSLWFLNRKAKVLQKGDFRDHHLLDPISNGLYVWGASCQQGMPFTSKVPTYALYLYIYSTCRFPLARIRVGAPEELKYPLSRSVFLMSVVFGLLIVTAYSAVLTSFLAVDVLSIPFSKWQDILNVASSWKLGIMMDSSDYDMLFNAYKVGISTKQ